MLIVELCSSIMRMSDLEIMSEKSELQCDSIKHADLRANDALAISFCLS